MNPFTVCGRCRHILSSIVQRQCLLICRFFALNAFLALGCMGKGEIGHIRTAAESKFCAGRMGSEAQSQVLAHPEHHLDTDTGHQRQGRSLPD